MGLVSLISGAGVGSGSIFGRRVGDVGGDGRAVGCDCGGGVGASESAEEEEDIGLVGGGRELGIVVGGVLVGRYLCFEVVLRGCSVGARAW